MRLRISILAATLAANVLLGGLIIKAHKNVPRETTASGDTMVPEQTPGRPASNPTVDAKPTAASSETLPASFRWAQLESEDYKKYIAALRDFGVPEQTVRDIIIADVRKLYRPRLAALRPPKTARTNFWEDRPFFGRSDNSTKEQREKRRALEKEQNDLIKSLLGTDVFREIAKESGSPDWTERMFGPLPSDVRDKVSEMQQRFQEASSEIYAKADGYVDEDTQKDLKALRKKYRDELATVLTPAQLEEYELRSSDTANQMRWQLGTFDPNEKEFRAIFAYKQAIEDMSPSNNGTDPQSRQQKQKDFDAALAEALGPDRLKEYKLMDQWEFRNLADAGVSRDDILKVADMKQQAQDAASQIRKDKTLSSDDRTEALDAVRTETEKSLAALLGERRAKAYTGNGGYWLRNIAPRN